MSDSSGPCLIRTAMPLPQHRQTLKKSILVRASLFFAGLLVTALLIPNLMAGIRGPWHYNGVVFYDRWDNCYLFSGVYLMYISEAVKETLRPYHGQSIEIDAKEVHQPMNPGDALIEKLVVVGESKVNAQSPPVEGVHLRAAVSNVKGTLRASVEIQNTGHSPIAMSSDALGFAVIAHGRPNFFCPSDGTSCAVITRISAASSGGKDRTGLSGQTWGWRVERANRLPINFTLQPGETRRTSVSFQLPAGAYQFIAGYGGGTHSGPCVASNGVSFDVDRN